MAIWAAEGNALGLGDVGGSLIKYTLTSSKSIEIYNLGTAQAFRMLLFNLFSIVCERTQMYVYKGVR